MKKLTLLLAVVSFFCLGKANAQDGKGSINFVPYVGVNYSDFSGDTKSYFFKSSGKVNFMAGARFEFKIEDNSDILIEYNFRRLGAFINTYDDIYEIHLSVEPLTVHYNKVILDCHTIGIQFKQNIIASLSARIGLEGTFSSSEYIHGHLTGKVASLKPGVVIGPNDNYDYNDTESFNIIEYDEDVRVKADGMFSDQPNFALPLGLTYDYRNFSFNATYHLPLTNCTEDRGGSDRYSMKHQAFDITVGYRLPLCKR